MGNRFPVQLVPLAEVLLAEVGGGLLFQIRVIGAQRGPERDFRRGAAGDGVQEAADIAGAAGLDDRFHSRQRPRVGERRSIS